MFEIPILRDHLSFLDQKHLSLYEVMLMDRLHVRTEDGYAIRTSVEHGGGGTNRGEPVSVAFHLHPECAPRHEVPEDAWTYVERGWLFTELRVDFEITGKEWTTDTRPWVFDGRPHWKLELESHRPERVV